MEDVSKKMIKKYTSFLMFFLICSVSVTLQPLAPTRVILACDANPEYLQFWPVVAKAWQELVGIRPTLALIASEKIFVDESLGDVIRFMPLKNVSTVFYAQCIRLLLPVLFPNDICIISDMDMLPLQRSYFIDGVKNIQNDHIAVYRSQAILEFKQFPMCYVAAKGSTFQEVFNCKTMQDIPPIIQKWAKMNRGWSTDQEVLYTYLRAWKKFASHCDLLNIKINRIDRSNWKYNATHLAQGMYTDCHCPRPYEKFKKSIDAILAQALAAQQKKLGCYTE